MKKYLILASAALVALAACNKEIEIQDPLNNADEVVLTFTSERPQLEASSKTAWDADNSCIVWESTDKIRVGYTLDGNWMGQDAAGTAKFYASKEVTLDDTDSSVGTFLVPITGSGVTAFSDPGTNGTYKFYAIYPSSILTSTTVNDPSDHNLTLATAQTPGGNTFDHATDIMVGATEDLSITGLPTTPIELSWTRVVAHVALTFSNMNFDGTETPSKISLTFNENAKVAGVFSINITDGTIGAGTANEIVLEGSGLTVSGTSINAWATVLPVSFSSLNVEVKTNKATYVREIASFTGGTKSFKKNARNTLTINMSSAIRTESIQYEWVKKNLADITSSDVFVVVADNGNTYAMSNDKGASAAPDAIAVTISNNKLSAEPAEKLQWNLARDGSNYTFYPNGTTSTWLYCTSGTGNKVRVGTTNTGNVFTLDASGYLKNSYNNYLGVYNSQDWRAYSSTSTGNIAGQTFAFYVKTVAGSTPTTNNFEDIAHLNGLATSDEANLSGKLTNAVVSFVPSANDAIIKDATGSILFHKEGHGLLQGQTFTGELDVTLLLYQGNYSELTACNAAFTGSETTVDPEDMTLADLVGSYSTYQNAYVKVEDLEVTAINNKNVSVTDGTNNYVVFTHYASSACSVGDIITVKGTVTHYGDNDQIKVWASDDLTVTTSAPVVAITLPYEESFASGQGQFSIDNVALDGLSSVWSYDSGNKYMKATGYVSSTNHAVESWLISPLLEIPTLSTGETIKLKFTQCINKYFGTVSDEATLMVKEESGSWTNVAITYPTLSGNWSSFEAQVVDLSSYAGKNIQFAFKYVGTSSANGTWEIKNVSVKKYEPKALSAISVSGQNTIFTVGDTFAFGGTVTATYNDETTADVTASATFSGYNMSSAGEQTVTVSYTESGVTKTTTYTITVNSADVEAVVYTLDGNTAGSGSSYAGDNVITQNNIGWIVNGNTQMTPWRIGGKSLDGVDRMVYSTTAIAKNISKIEITHGTASNITVNSMTVIVSKNADFSSPVSTLTPTFAANSTVTVNRPNGKDWSNCYYKIVYNVSVSGNTNRFIQFIGADFTGK